MRPSKKLSPLALAVLLALTGCGGGGGGKSPAARGTNANFAITWGARSRAIQGPSSALSATVTLASGSSARSTLGTTVNRSGNLEDYTGEYATRDAVPPGTYVLRVRFFAEKDGSGDVVAQGTANVTIAADGNGIGSVGTGNAVASVQVVPSQIVPSGVPVQLLFSARDAQGTLLALSPGSATWSQQPSSGAMSLTDDGMAQGDVLGPVYVQVKVDTVESEATLVTVSHAPIVSISVDPYQRISLGETKSLTSTARTANGTVVFLAPEALAWSVLEGGSVLRVSPAGVATALRVGTARVRASANGVTSAPQTITVPDPNSGNTVPATLPYFVYLTVAGGDGSVFDLDAGGNIAVGYQRYGDTTAPLIWKDPSTEAQTPPAADPSSSAYLAAISGDGRVALGTDASTLQGGIPTLFGMDGTRTALPLPAGKTRCDAVDLSFDGTVVLCADAPQTSPFDPRPYVVRGGTVTYLPLPAGTVRVRVAAISGDGSTVVGTLDDRAVRWVNEGSPEFIAQAPSGASGVSFDGQVIVGGQSNDPQMSSVPFRWTAGNGTETLTARAPFTLSPRVIDISDDGRTVLIAGDEYGGFQGVPQLWREGRGTETLEALFAAAGGNGAGFDGAGPSALSGDGRTVIGGGRRVGPGSAGPGSWKLRLP